MAYRVPGVLILLAMAALASPARADDVPPNEVSGVIRVINGATLQLATRTGALVQVDATDALVARQTSLLAVGGAVTALGSRDGSGVLHATSVGRAKTSPLAWPADH